MPHPLRKNILSCTATAVLLLSSASVAADDSQPQNIGTLAAAHTGAPSGSATATADNGKGGAGESHDAATASSGTPGKISKSDQNMMQELAMANLAELAASKLALTKAQSPDVKQYAQRMIDDHTTATKELQAYAKSKGVSLPTEPDAQHQAAAKKLAGLSGEKFDKAYMSQAGVTDHRNTVRLLTRISKGADDQQLKLMANKMIPHVENHLQTAELIAGVRGKSQPRDMQTDAPGVR